MHAALGQRHIGIEIIEATYIGHLDSITVTGVPPEPKEKSHDSHDSDRQHDEDM